MESREHLRLEHVPVRTSFSSPYLLMMMRLGMRRLRDPDAVYQHRARGTQSSLREGSAKRRVQKTKTAQGEAHGSKVHAQDEEEEKARRQTSENRGCAAAKQPRCNAAWSSTHASASAPHPPRQLARERLVELSIAKVRRPRIARLSAGPPPKPARAAHFHPETL
jgi:hypothetical protein